MSKTENKCDLCSFRQVNLLNGKKELERKIWELPGEYNRTEYQQAVLIQLLSSSEIT